MVLLKWCFWHGQATLNVSDFDANARLFLPPIYLKKPPFGDQCRFHHSEQNENIGDIFKAKQAFKWHRHNRLALAGLCVWFWPMSFTLWYLLDIPYEEQRFIHSATAPRLICKQNTCSLWGGGTKREIFLGTERRPKNMPENTVCIIEYSTNVMQKVYAVFPP